MQEREGSGSKVILVYWLNLLNRDLSIAEAYSLSKMCDINAQLIKESYDKVYIEIKSKKLCGLAYRIAFNKRVGVLLDDTGFYQLKDAVRVESTSLSLKKKAISYLMEKGVLLDKKSNKVLYVLEDKEYVLIKKTYKESEFKTRHPNLRPGFMPFSLKPRIAQLLLNLAQVFPGEYVLDPFVGVGGILLEVELFARAKGYGVELYNDVLWKAIKNKTHYGCTFDLIKGDATALPFKNHAVDAIVSDLPYGRSSRQRKHFDDLYHRFFKEAHKVLKPGKKVVIMVNTPKLIHQGFMLEGMYGLYSHRSLTRYIYVLKRL